MSNEFNNQIQEGMLNDKLLDFYKKFKIYIFSILLLIIILPIIYQVNIVISKNKKEKEFEDYSVAISLINKNEINEAKKILSRLIVSDNNILALISINKFLEIYENSSKEKLNILEMVAKNKNLNKKNLELINIKKALIKFDDITEEELNNILDIKSDNANFKEISSQILYDFYMSKNEKKKALQIKNINEK